MPDAKMDPVVVPAGKCRGCPWRGTFQGRAFCHLAPEPVEVGIRPSWCPLGTQDAVRWTPEVVGEPDPTPRP